MNPALNKKEVCDTCITTRFEKIGNFWDRQRTLERDIFSKCVEIVDTNAHGKTLFSLSQNY